MQECTARVLEARVVFNKIQIHLDQDPETEHFIMPIIAVTSCTNTIVLSQYLDFSSCLVGITMMSWLDQLLNR